MLYTRSLAFIVLIQFLVAPVIWAKDFDWMRELSVQAQADPSGFVARLSTRFRVGDAEVRAVIDNIGGHAEAYMVMRLAEMSHHPIEYVSQQYETYHKKGWGALAKSLGIKPGSKEFHALKAGHDLDYGVSDNNGKANKKSHGKNKDKHNK